MERVILVDEHEHEIGAAEKMQAHRDGSLHRAFSVLVFDAHGRTLLQRRAAGKYHSPNLWSNSCCGHPRPGESITEAAERRLGEEFGFSCPLTEVAVFRYRAELGNGIVEHEFDHVLVGQWSGEPLPRDDEIGAWRWIALDDLERAVKGAPERFTVWLPLVLDAFAARDALPDAKT